MITAEFVTSSGQICPVLVIGYKRGLVEVYAMKYKPFTERGSFPPQTHAVKRGLVNKCDLINLRSTRIK